jgi:hypothetical protein
MQAVRAVRGRGARVKKIMHDGKWVHVDQAPAVPPLDPQFVALLASDWLRSALQRMEVERRALEPPRPRNASARRAARRRPRAASASRPARAGASRRARAGAAR